MAYSNAVFLSNAALLSNDADISFEVAGLGTISELMALHRPLLPLGLEKEINAIVNKEESNFKAFLISNENDYWIVQLSFYKDWIFTLKIMKAMKQKRIIVEFHKPCLYKNYPLMVDEEGILFPTFHHMQVTYSSAFLCGGPDGLLPPKLKITLSDLDELSRLEDIVMCDDVLGYITVDFDKVYKALFASLT